MPSRTVGHPYWMARCIERAGQAARRLAAQPQHRGARQRAAMFSAPSEVRDAV